MSNLLQHAPGFCSGPHSYARVRDFVTTGKRGESGAISTLTLALILAAPLVVLGALAFVLIFAYANRVARVTAELEARKKPTLCPACGHHLVEVRKFCAECGASIRPPETEVPGDPNVSREEPE